MNYETTRACRLVATRCSCCNRPLVDAKSVEFGIGPDCRSKYGFDDVPTAPDFISAKCLTLNHAPDIDESVVEDWTNAREVCNFLVHRFACDVVANSWVPLAIYALGYVKLSEKLSERGGTVTVLPVEGYSSLLSVKAPYNVDFNSRLYRVPGRFFDRASKTWRVPVSSKGHLWDAIRLTFPGLTLRSAKGLTLIEKFVPRPTRAAA